MVDVFDRIEWKVREIFGKGPVCVHVGDVKRCDIKRHPTYSKFRKEALSAGIRSAASSRVWESLIAMGRLSDLDGDDTWRLVILDCIVPCFRGVAARVSRDFRVEREEVQSAMVVAALEVWRDTTHGVPPRNVRDKMVKAAFEVAFRYASGASSEWSSDEIELMIQSEVFTQESALKASSVIDINSIRDADVAEQLRGERIGALFQLLGHFGVVREFHDDLRAGRRSGSVRQTMTTSMLLRSRISGPSLYYYTSDLYPPYIGLREAAAVMGVPESAAHRLIRVGQFPFPVARAGRSYKVSVKALMHFKDIPDVIVHVDDVENGALHVSGGL
ncbi:helix-turn-helix transcriptional regulator [Streptomyces murinus]|uniref:helix-turn-helix transcriptional regulator n=1 Tax=Streptomyces murinus TaxID=33900 RepID=UPI00380CC8C1